MRNYVYEQNFGIFGNVYFLLFILFLLAVIFFYFLKKDKPEAVNTLSRNEALEILKMRYAKGEINEEEFERIKKAIM